jgi:release factor glutamine methyltransferase
MHFDLIVSNPPYVKRGDKHLHQGSLPFEPVSALVAEENGLADIRSIAQQAKICLKKDSWLLVEHGYQQKEEVVEILRQAGYENIECSQDLAGLDRLTRAQCKQ